MKAKEFSGINELPRGKAPESYIEGCMALEGGAFRGVYTSGVLDYLLEQGINLTTTVGVSAGALNGMNYVAGDIGRSGLCNLKHRHDDRWVGRKAIKTDKGVMGFEFLKTGLELEYPLDRERFLNPIHRLVAVATNIETGKPEYFDSSKEDFDTMFTAISASASMPFVSKPVVINNQKYLDGGCSTKLPIRWAVDQGFEKIVFVATRESTYRRREKHKESVLLKELYHEYPHLREAYMSASRVYNEDCNMVDRLVEEGRIFRIAPSEPVDVKRLEGDMEKLGALYYLGYKDAKNSLEALKKYLNI